MKHKKFIAFILSLSVWTMIIAPAGVKGETKNAMFQNDLQHTGVYTTEDNAKEKSVKWRFQTEGRINSSPVLYDGVSFFGSTDDYFYAVDNKNGTLKWKFKTGGDTPYLSRGL